MSDEDDDENLLDGRHHFGKRYLDPKELADYVKTLRPEFTWVSKDFLEALERDRVLVPVKRVRIPPAVARAIRGEDSQWPYYDASLEVAAPDSPDLVAATSLARALDLWDAPKYAPALHPLDAASAEHTRLIEDPATEPFQAWSSFRYPIGLQPSKGSPLYDDRAVDTYYHYWQAFVAAEAQSMRWAVHFNVLDKELSEALRKGEFERVEQSAYASKVSDGRDVRKLLAHAACFNATAWDQAYGNRAFGLAIGNDSVLTGAPLDALREKEIAISREAVERHGVTPENLVAFLRMLAERWIDSKEKDRKRLARHYRRCFSAGYWLYQRVTGREYDQVVSDVGKVGGYFKPIIRVMFPDWIEETEEGLLSTLKDCNREWTEHLRGEPKLLDQDATELVAWLAKERMFTVSWHFKHANAVWRDLSEVGIAGLAKEVEGFAVMLEQVVGSFAPGRTLMPKFKALWTPAAAPKINGDLGRLDALTHSDQKPFADLVTQIAQLESSAQISHLTAALLRALLVRNHGAHSGLSAEDPQNLWKYFRGLVMTLSLSWKQAKDQGLLAKATAAP